MHSQTVSALDLGPPDVVIKRELSRSEASSIYEAQLFGKACILKLVSSILDPQDDADGPVS